MRYTSIFACMLSLKMPNDLSLDIAKICRLQQSRVGIAGRNKLVRDVAMEIRGRDSAHDPIPLHFLLIVQFMPAGNAAGVEVPDPLNILLDGVDQIAFHNLHVVDVVQELHVRRIHLLHHLHTPGGVIAHVILVIHLAIQQFHADGDAVILGNFLDSIQSNDGILRPLLIGETGAITGERDHIRNAGFGRQRDIFAKSIFDGSVIFEAIQALGNLSAAGIRPWCRLIHSVGEPHTDRD